MARTRKMTVTVEQARELAKAMPGLSEAVDNAVEASWDAMTILATPQGDGTYDVQVVEPDGVMVAWFLPAWDAEEIAIPGGVPPAMLHVTLAYMGKVDQVSIDDQRRIVGIVGEVTRRHKILHGKLNGTGTFPTAGGEEAAPFWIGVEVPGLEELVADLLRTFQSAGIKTYNHDKYVPHVTVAYMPPMDPGIQAMDFGPWSIWMHSLTVAIGSQRVDIELPSPEEDVEREQTWKAVDTVTPDRYTLAPLYVPDQLDAHNEYTDVRELQLAVWEYMRSGDRRIRLQHHKEIVAGEMVELCCWPFEVTVPLTMADGTVTERTYPANTPFLGVIWEPWSWELIELGEIRGYSIGGSADMIDVDLGADAVDKARDKTGWKNQE